MSIEVLYTSESIRQSIRSLFRKGAGRRVAVVAFVGNAVEAYLPSPAGLELYCWPSPTATNPAAIKRLQKRGVNVFFAPRMHMKIYWSQRYGAIVASSNLSQNAYGHGDLKEFGVRLAPGSINIDRVIRNIKAKPVTARSLKSLENSRILERRLRGGHSREKADRQTFAQWYELSRRESWKMAPYHNGLVASRELKSAVAKDGVDGQIANWVSAGKNKAKENDYLLLVNASSDKNLTNADWLFASHVVHVGRSERGYCAEEPYQVGQAHTLSRYRLPPFNLDSRFRSALRSVSGDLKPHEFARYFDYGILRPTPRLLELLYRAYVA